MRTKKEKSLVFISVGIFVAFLIATVVILFATNDSSDFSISVSSSDTSVLEYRGSFVGDAYNVGNLEEIIIVNNSKIIFANQDSVYCVACKVQRNSRNDLILSSGTAFVSKNGFGYAYIGDKRIGINGDSKVIIKVEEQEVLPVEGELFLDETLEEISGENKAVYLVDSFVSREISSEDYTNSSTRNLLYFLFDLNELPQSLNQYSPISDLL